MNEGNAVTILVVDDEPGMRETLSDIFLELGYLVRTASDGQSAVHAVKTRDYDLVLMDVRMPGMSGQEALLRIKETRPMLPVILMTAHESTELSAEAVTLADAVASKPLNIGRLLDLFASLGLEETYDAKL